MKKGQTSHQESSDQDAQDKSVRSLLNNYTERIPLVLLADDKYALFPFDLAVSGYTYVVLGFYRIIHAWGKEQAVKHLNLQLVDVTAIVFSGIPIGGR